MGITILQCYLESEIFIFLLVDWITMIENERKREHSLGYVYWSDVYSAVYRECRQLHELSVFVPHYLFVLAKQSEKGKCDWNRRLSIRTWNAR